MAGFAADVYRVVRRCPRGKVISYGAVAALVGRPRAARAVGAALKAMPDDTDVPWWRVINSDGVISIRGVAHGDVLQRILLEREGVVFSRNGRVSWEQFGWQGD